MEIKRHEEELLQLQYEVVKQYISEFCCLGTVSSMHVTYC